MSYTFYVMVRVPFRLTVHSAEDLDDAISIAKKETLVSRHSVEDSSPVDGWTWTGDIGERPSTGKLVGIKKDCRPIPKRLLDSVAEKWHVKER